jgi:hypothetical protein
MTKAEKTADTKLRIHRIGKSLASWRFYLAHSGQGDKTPGGASKTKLSAKRIAEVKATMAKLEAERTTLRATLPDAEAPKPRPAAKKKEKGEAGRHGLTPDDIDPDWRAADEAEAEADRITAEAAEAEELAESLRETGVEVETG